MIDQALTKALHSIASSSAPVTVLTGAGISAESGIPTFRGPEGYWTIGSHEYHPQEMATNEMFRLQPEEVWKWYLYRLSVCRKASPNVGHQALVDLEEWLGDRFTLITQNVDGLHLRAGNSLDRTYQIHGNLEFMRCSESCTEDLHRLPKGITDKEKGDSLTAEELELLRCPRCHVWVRPHVLWFDESYNEKWYRFESSLDISQKTRLLIVVGTSGATNLPSLVVNQVLLREGYVVNIDIERNRFAEMALASGHGFFLQHSSSKGLPELVECFREAA